MELSDLDGTFEGVPTHLKPHVVKWLAQQFDRFSAPESAGATIAMRLRVNVRPAYAQMDLISAGVEDDDRMLDIVEGVLRLLDTLPGMYAENAAASFNHLLELSGSAYEVTEDYTVVDVTSDEMEAIRSRAVSNNDPAAEELSEAWVIGFGRSPDPSDAWDHAIKAVEAVLQPVVEPNNSKATLGIIISTLNSASAKWECAFPGVDKDHDVSNLMATLRLMWPNPDRHGPVTRTPTLVEARSVVTLAATVVQWHREGYVVRKR